MKERQRRVPDVPFPYQIETGAGFQRIASVMLQDEQAAGSQYAVFANGSYDFLCDRIAIGRVCKHDIHRTAMVGEMLETLDRIRHPDPGLSAFSVPYGRLPPVIGGLHPR